MLVSGMLPCGAWSAPSSESSTPGRCVRDGMTVLKVENGLITEENRLDDGVTALGQLGLIAELAARGDVVGLMTDYS